MSRATIAQVGCMICGDYAPGVAMAAVPGEDDDHPQLFQACASCLNEMFDVAKTLEMRLRESVRGTGAFRRADYGPDWTRVHDAILERDENRCQDIDHQVPIAGESLVVHHIKPLKEFGGNYLSAHQPENLITLCLSCHGRWHGALTRAKNQERLV